MSELFGPSKSTRAIPKDTDIPAHRMAANEYFLRIGDCQFIIPPTNIRVIKSSAVNLHTGLRQMEPIKTKNGYTTTQINIELFFNGIEQINGFEIAAPDGGKYYMDGLRSLIAQFRRLPFLPIVNEHLNNIHDIYNVALASMVTQSVPGFPYVFKVGLTLYKMTVTPYINLPDWSYDEIIMYPVFRWYYQQMLRSENSLSKMTLSPINNFDTGLHAFVLRDDVLREASSKIDGSNTPATWQEMPIPEDLFITNFTISMGNVLTPMQLNYVSEPTYQYFGSMDTRVSLTMHTQNKGAIVALDELRAILERYSRLYRNRLVTGYAMVYNEILSLFGITYVMIENMAVNTVEGYPGTFEIVLDLISYDKTRRASDVVDPQANGAKLMKVPYLDGGYGDLITKENNSKMNAINDIKLNKFINQIELYPDLELPPLQELAKAVDQINAYRKNKGQEVLPVTSANYKSHEMSVYANPDFYISYTAITSLPANTSDIEAIINSSKAVQHKQGVVTASAAAAALAAKTGSKPESSTTPGNVPKWPFDNLIYKYAAQYNIPPIYLAAIIMTESSGDPNSGSSAGARGLMQLMPDTARSYGWDGSSSLYDPETNIKCGSAYFAKLVKQFRDDAKWSNWLELATSAYNSGEYVPSYKRGEVPNYKETKAYYPKFSNFVNVLAPNFGTPDSSYSSTNSNSETQPTSNTMTVDDVLVKRLLEGNKIPKTSPIAKIDLPKDKASQIKWLEEDHDPVIDCKDPSDPTQLGDLIEEMGIDMRLYNQRNTMNRAFPTFLMLMVDEGLWIDGRRLWDNYYAYHMLTSIEITHERSQPVGTAIITMSDIYGALNYTPWHTYNIPDVSLTGVFGFADKALKSIAEGLDKNFHMHMLDDYKRLKFGILPTINDEIIKDRNAKNMMLNVVPGTRIHLRMGYGSVASLLPVSFNGTIVEIDTGDIVTAVCQSDGLELINLLGEFAGQADATNSYYDLWGLNLGAHPQGIFFKILKDRDHNLVWSLTNSKTNDSKFGYLAGICKRYGVNNAYGIEHFGYLDHADEVDNHDNEDWAGRLFNMDGYDLIKNIYSSYFGYEELNWSHSAGNEKYKIKKGDCEPDILMKMTDKSLWDVGQVLADTVPEYICAPHYHGFHSTLFYGMPHYYVKYDYDLSDPAGDYSKENLVELYKPFQQIHILNSAEDILHNGIKASSKDLATIVAPSYVFDDELTCDDKIWADPTMKPELLKVQSIDTQIVQDFFMTDWIRRYLVGNVMSIGKGLIEMWDAITASDVDKATPTKIDKAKRRMSDQIDKDWNPGRFQARNAGVSYMIRNFRNMYKGEITILGDPAIKPHDSIMLTDFYSKMHGTVNAGRVTHRMSIETGFMTSIKPDLIATFKGSTRGFIHSTSIKLIGGVVAYAVAWKLAIKFVARKSDLVLTSSLKSFAASPIKTTKGLITGFKAAGRATAEIIRASEVTGETLGMISRIRVFVRSLFIVSGSAELGVAIPSAGGALVALAVEIVIWSLIDQAFNYIEREFFPQSAINIYPLFYKDWPYVAGIDGARQIIPGFSLDKTSPSSDGDIQKPSGSSESSNGNLSYYPLAKSDCNGTRTAFGLNKNYSSGIHHGLDFGTGLREDRPIYAHYDGIVHSIGLNASFVYGKHIILRHENHPKSGRKGYFTLYAHLNSVNVSIGGSVKAGVQIGLSGQTGRCKGAHLHFECRESSDDDGDPRSAFNPMELLSDSTYPA